MSALGNLRIDMLAESSGLLLRIFCEDRPRMAFLQSLAEQLQGRLQDLPIRGMTFTTGVESPTRELLKKLVPGSRGMLDARI